MPYECIYLVYSIRCMTKTKHLSTVYVYCELFYNNWVKSNVWRVG